MAESTVIRTLQDITITVTDGTESYTVAYEPGDFTFEVPLFNVENFLDRGRMPSTPSIRRGDDNPMSLSWTVNERDWGDTTAADHATMLDLAVEFAGAYVAGNWTSTIGANSDSTLRTYTVNATQEGSDFGGSDLTLGFTYVTLRGNHSDGYPNTNAITGTSYTLRPTLS